MTNRPTDRPTDGHEGGVIGKLHFQWKRNGLEKVGQPEFHDLRFIAMHRQKWAWEKKTSTNIFHRNATTFFDILRYWWFKNKRFAIKYDAYIYIFIQGNIHFELSKKSKPKNVSKNN